MLTPKLTRLHSLERLENTVATLLDRLGEGPAKAPGHELSRPTPVQTSPGSGGAYKDAESSTAPIMVIRDLATDNGIKPMSDARSLGVVLDDLISPELSLKLITMYAALLYELFYRDKLSLTLSQFPRILRSMGSLRSRL